MHSQLKLLPPAVTHSLVQQLPPETQDMAAAALEMGAGMEEDEVAELVSGLQASAASPGEGGGGAESSFY